MYVYHILSSHGKRRLHKQCKVLEYNGKLLQFLQRTDTDTLRIENKTELEEDRHRE